MITKVKVLVVKSSETSHLLQPTLTEKVEETLRITTPPPIAGGHGKKSAKKGKSLVTKTDYNAWSVGAP